MGAELDRVIHSAEAMKRIPPSQPLMRAQWLTSLTTRLHTVLGVHFNVNSS